MSFLKSAALAGLATRLKGISDRQVISNVRWTLAGNALYAASQWLMVVVLARWTDPQTVGTLALALAVTAPVTLFFNMQLRAVIATDVTGKYRLRDYFQTRVITTGAALTAILVGLTLFHRGAETISVILLIALSKAGESFSDIIQGYWQLAERMDLVGKSLSVRALVTLGAFTLGVTTTRSLTTGAAAFVLGSVTVFLAYDVKHITSVLPPLGGLAESPGRLFDFRRVTRATPAALVGLALPLGVAAMVISLNSAIPRYFLEAYSGKRQLGIYAALSYFIVVGNLLTNAVGQSVLPRLAKLYTSQEQRRFRHLLAALLACSAAVGAASMAIALGFGKRILLIYGKEYANAYPVFLIIMAAASIGYFISILNFTLNAIGAYKIQMPLFLVTTALLLFTCRVLIPTHGIAGAAIALLICSGSQATLSATVLVLRARARDAHAQGIPQCEPLVPMQR